MAYPFDPAVTDLYAASREELARFLTARVCCPTTARDLVQESFIKLATAGDLPRVRDLKAYLFRIAGNLATDHQRAQRRRASLAAELGAAGRFARPHGGARGARGARA
jgi:DNA-directed RNA polymerase specialized sigma24 family protein